MEFEVKQVCECNEAKTVVGRLLEDKQHNRLVLDLGKRRRVEVADYSDRTEVWVEFPFRRANPYGYGGFTWR